MRWLGIWISIVSTSSAATGVWLDVPFVRQPENGCGSAVTSMILQYWAGRGHSSLVSSNVDDVQSRLYSKAMEGVTAADMQQYFREAGYEVYTFRGDAETLEKNLRKGRPLIVYLEDDGLGQIRHYVVVVGISLNEGLILVNDPAERKLKKIPWTVFQKQWEMAECWTLLALPSTGR